MTPFSIAPGLAKKFFLQTFILKRCPACSSAPWAATAPSLGLQPDLPWEGWSEPTCIPTAREAQHRPPRNSSDDTEPLWRQENRAFFVQTSPAVGKMHFLPQTVFILAAGPVWRCNSGRASAWRGEHCQATCSWPRLLCCCSHCEGSTGHVQQARQVGDRQQVKSAGYFLRKKQLKTTRIKQDWKPLAKKQGPVWSSASSNFLSRSEHKR